MFKKILLYLTLGGLCSLMLGIPIAKANLGGSFSAPSGLTTTAADLLYCKLVGCTLTGPLSITNGSGSPSLNIAPTVSTANGISMRSDNLSKFATIGPAGSEQVGIYVGAAGPALNVSAVNGNLSGIQVTATSANIPAILVNGKVSGLGATASSNSGSGTCTAVTVNGTDFRGSITATCTAGQTVIMTFGATFSSAPFCVISPANAAADPVGSGSAFVTTATGNMTLTVPTAATTGIWNYQCIQ